MLDANPNKDSIIVPTSEERRFVEGKKPAWAFVRYNPRRMQHALDKFQVGSGEWLTEEEVGLESVHAALAQVPQFRKKWPDGRIFSSKSGWGFPLKAIGVGAMIRRKAAENGV